MMFLDLLFGILLGMFIAAITALVIVVTCLLFKEFKK